MRSTAALDSMRNWHHEQSVICSYTTNPKHASLVLPSISFHIYSPVRILLVVQGRPTLVASSIPVSTSTKCTSSSLTNSPTVIVCQSRPTNAGFPASALGGLFNRLCTASDVDEMESCRPLRGLCGIPRRVSLKECRWLILGEATRIEGERGTVGPPPPPPPPPVLELGSSLVRGETPPE